MSESFGAEELVKSPHKPEVVFAGSSMTLMPLEQIEDRAKEAAKQNGALSILPVTDKILSASTSIKLSAFNVAYFGFMISDVYFIVDHYLVNDAKPKVLVLTVAPRDFYDSGFSNPALGIAFRRMSGLSNLLSFCGTYLITPADYTDFLVGKSMFMYSMRPKFQEKAYLWFSSYLPKKTLATKDQSTFSDSLKNYRRRYENISPDRMERQFDFLQKLLALCKRRGIKTILVDAPLTKANQALLPDGIYDYYETKVAALGTTNANYFLPLSSSPRYSRADFFDCVHLNKKGARMWLEEISPPMRELLSECGYSNGTDLTSLVSGASERNSEIEDKRQSIGCHSQSEIKGKVSRRHAVAM